MVLKNWNYTSYLIKLLLLLVYVCVIKLLVLRKLKKNDPSMRQEVPRWGPKLKIGHGDPLVRIGQLVTLSCRVDQAQPDPTLSWFVNGQPASVFEVETGPPTRLEGTHALVSVSVKCYQNYHFRKINQIKKKSN